MEMFIADRKIPPVLLFFASCTSICTQIYGECALQKHFKKAADINVGLRASVQESVLLLQAN